MDMENVFNRIKIRAISIIIFCITINAKAFVNIDNSIPHLEKKGTAAQLIVDESGQGQRLSLRDASKIYHVKAYWYR